MPLAIHAAEIREKSIGIHPYTARNLYFIGSLYDSLGDKYIKKGGFIYMFKLDILSHDGKVSFILNIPI